MNYAIVLWSSDLLPIHTYPCGYRAVFETHSYVKLSCVTIVKPTYPT